MSPESFFLPEGPDSFVATEWTRGPWSRDAQHGGPPAALLAGACEKLLGADAFVARLTVEFLRPVPQARVRGAATMVKPGRKVRAASASLLLGDVEVARATALAIRRLDAPLAFADVAMARELPSLEASTPWKFPFFPWETGYDHAIEARVARGAFGEGRMAAWMRLRVGVVAGEAPSPLQRVAAAADSGNGLSAALPVADWTFVNPELTVHLHRPLEGEWLLLDARTLAHPSGIGLAQADLFDARGAIGRSEQSLVVERRD